MKRFASLFSLVYLSENLQSRLRALSSFRKTSSTYKSEVQTNFSHTPMRKTMFIIILRYVHQEKILHETRYDRSQRRHLLKQSSTHHKNHVLLNKTPWCIQFTMPQIIVVIQI